MNYLYKIRNICVYANNIILQDIAWYLYNDIYYSFSNKSIDIYIGIHEYKEVKNSKTINIGIQTEQYVDYKGNKLWRYNNYDLKRKQYQYDLIIEINSNNKKLYDQNVDNVIYGPYIFGKPYKSANKLNHTNNQYFIGSINKRREYILSGVRSIQIVDNKHGEDLYNILLTGSSIYNIHYQKGLYNEWPRIFLAYKYDMTLISEQLQSNYLIVTNKLSNSLYEYKISEEIEKFNIQRIIKGKIKKISATSDKYFYQYHISRLYNYLRLRVNKYILKTRHWIHPKHRI